MPQLEFKGKSLVYNHHLAVAHHCLQADASKSILAKGANPSLHDNVILHGDNLLALKALVPTHAGRVNCIYIDPPYNTGNEGWCYNDNVNNPMIQQWLGKTVDTEDLARHDKWLCMMWPRLSQLHEMLAEDGVIFVSIDDNEQHRLRMIMDEIFGEENFVANIMWNSTKSITNPALVSVSHTHTLTYCKNLDSLKNKRSEFKLPPSLEGFSNPDNDERGAWKADPFEAGGERPNQMYPITNPQTGEVFYPSKGNCWKNDLKKFKTLLADNRIVFGKSGKSRPQRKRFLSEAKERGLTPNTWWSDVGTTTTGTMEYKHLFGDKEFCNPKPTLLIRKLLQLATNKDSIVLDSFAGSGTTAQAVLELNAEDNGNRKFVLIECEDYADKITAERVRRIMRGTKTAKDPALNTGLGGTFSYWQLGEALELDNLLDGDNLPTYPNLAAYVFYIATGEQWNPAELREKDYFIGTSAKYEVYLFYQPDLEYLKNTALTLNLAESLPTPKTKPRLVFAPARYANLNTLDRLKIKYCQLPFEVYKTAGRIISG